MGNNADTTRADTWGASYSVSDATWVLMARPGAALLIEEADDAEIHALVQALSADDPGGAVLGRLLLAGLAGLPSFAFAETTPGGWRVMVRGSAVAVAGDERVDGAEFTTWAERLLTGEEITLRNGTAAEGRRLVLRDGVVQTDSVTLRAGAPVSSTSVPEAATSESNQFIEPAGPSRSAGSAPSAIASPPRAEPEPEPASSTPPSAPTPPAPVITAPPVSPPPAPAPAPVSENTIADFTSSGQGDAYAHLFEETVVRPIEAAAVREPDGVENETPTPAPPVESDEHDGMTVLSGDLQKLRRQAAAENAERRGGSASDLDSGRPAQLTLVFSTGQREPLTGSVIVGRSPSATKVSAGSIPRLVAIPDDPDLSRSHARVDLSGDSAVVTDLHSVNGTSIQLPGQTPQRLRAGVPSTVLPGTIIDLGGGLTITVTDEEDLA